MAEAFPEDLAHLLGATHADARERAWESFLASRSALLLHAARSMNRDQDETIEAYTYVLDRLREDECRRLREYRHRPGAQFSTWLVLVARRLCVDRDRKLHGRSKPAAYDSDTALERHARRRLTHLAGEEIEIDTFADAGTGDPEYQLRVLELRKALEGALATLDARDRLLLTYRFVDRLSAHEIAELQHWESHLHVYRRLTRVLEELRRRLAKLGVESPVP